MLWSCEMVCLSDWNVSTPPGHLLSARGGGCSWEPKRHESGCCFHKAGLSRGCQRSASKPASYATFYIILLVDTSCIGVSCALCWWLIHNSFVVDTPLLQVDTPLFGGWYTISWWLTSPHDAQKYGDINSHIALGESLIVKATISWLATWVVYYPSTTKNKKGYGYWGF